MDHEKAGLTARWADLLPGTPEVGSALIAAYCAPARRYHDLAHLHAVLDGVDLLGPAATNLRLVRLAAWFHDAVYDVGGSDNEERSATWAEAAVEAAGSRVDEAREVGRLVRLTAGHAAERGDANGSVLCDADLRILASPSDSYAAYTAAVRQEFSHVGDADFRAGRAAILTQLLALPSLYRTAHGQAHWEANARRNLEAELRGLR